MGARARACARRIVTGGSVLERLSATRTPGTDAGHEQERLRGWWLTAMVAHGGGGGGECGNVTENEAPPPLFL